MCINEPISKGESIQKAHANSSFILNLVLEKPGIYLHEIQQEQEVSRLFDVSLATLFTVLHKIGFTDKKMGTVALQQVCILKEQFSSEVSVYNTEMFIFVDEIMH